MERSIHVKNPWWENKRIELGVSRPKEIEQIQKNFDQKLIQVITGLRRVGKSTILMQFIQYIIQDRKINPLDILYFTAEDPAIKDYSLSEVINEFRAEFGHKTKKKIYVFIDEIQFRDEWEVEIKTLYDAENIKFVLSGSSALLLSERLSYLTGRYLKIQIYPLSFEEFIKFNRLDLRKEDEFHLLKQVQNYLEVGGMPENVLNKPDRYLQTTVESILFKDLVSKFQIRNPSILSELILLLSDRVSSVSSSLKLSKILDFNKDTLLTYLDYLSKTFITSSLKNYSKSRNKQVYNAKKYYFEDTGICNVFASKSNFGALAENAIFNHIYRTFQEQPRFQIGYWYEDSSEVDFVVETGVSRFMVESKWIDKFDQSLVDSVLYAMEKEKITTCYIVTRNLNKKVVADGMAVIFIPLYQFLLLEKHGFRF